MQRLKKSVTFETAFAEYVATELLGEGGAGRVFGGTGPDGLPVAIKVLKDGRASAEKRRRFKNEIAFLTRNQHLNIVSVIDHGVSRISDHSEPFYVMQRYDESLRNQITSRLNPDQALPLFGQVLDGVEAAHLQNVTHRDLKPENILYSRSENRLAIADFGIAHFSEELLATMIETTPSTRLANFEYAAPEQRAPGKSVDERSDIYALGLILNEMFTGIVPHGTDYPTIQSVASGFGFLDSLVAKMLANAPSGRPSSIREVKGLIQHHVAEAVALQRLSEINGRVIKSDEIDEPLALDPPRLVDFDWNRGSLTLTLDRPVSPQWVMALHNLGNFSSIYGKPPAAFSFNGRTAVVAAREHELQQVIDFFKMWLPQATRAYKARLGEIAQSDEQLRRENLRREREAEESRLRALRNVRI